MKALPHATATGAAWRFTPLTMLASPQVIRPSPPARMTRRTPCQNAAVAIGDAAAHWGHGFS
jgi:hypothetical protein